MPVLRINFRESRPMEVSVRRWNEIGREAHRAGAELWQDEMLKKHFTPQAKFDYHHQARKPKYLESKARAAARGFARAADIDNLFTGRLYHNLKSTSAIAAFPTRATINMIGPRYITMRVNKQGGSPQPDKKAEILTDTEADVEAIVSLVERKLWDGVQENHGSKSTDL